VIEDMLEKQPVR